MWVEQILLWEFLAGGLAAIVVLIVNGFWSSPKSKKDKDRFWNSVVKRAP